MLERIAQTFGRRVAAIVEDDAILRVALADKVDNARSVVRDDRYERQSPLGPLPA